MMFKANSCLLFYAFVIQCNLAYAGSSSCHHALQIVVDKVEENYVGFSDRTRDLVELAKVQTDERIANSTKTDCLPFILEWLGAFSDPHLQATRLTLSAQSFDASSSASPIPPKIEWLSNEVVLLVLPSFHQGHIDKFRELIEQHRHKLTLVKGMIVDLRGNSNGSFVAMFPAVELIGVGDYHSRWHVLSSTKNTDYYRELLTEDRLTQYPEQLKVFSRLVEEMDEYPNTWIEFTWPAINPMRTLSNLQHIYILQNDTVSFSGEEFIIAVSSNDKVTTFGSVTEGKLDYAEPISHQILGQYILNIPSQKRVWYQLGPIDNVGIEPDLTLSISEDEAVDFLYRKMVTKLN